MLIMSGINADILKHISLVQHPHHIQAFLVYHYQTSLKGGFWSNETLWERFYSKIILTSEKNFQTVPVNHQCFEERRMAIWTPLHHTQNSLILP